MENFKSLLKACEDAGFRVVETNKKDNDYYASLQKGNQSMYIDVSDNLSHLAHIDEQVCLSCGKAYDMTKEENDMRHFCDCGGELIIQGDLGA